MPDLFLQQLQNLFQLVANLLNNLVALRGIFLRLFAGELLARATDGEALIVQQASDLANQDHVVTLVVAAIATALYRLQL